MDFSFMQEWWFMLLMVVILLGLIGVLLYMRNKRTDE
jgi:LPXTG-motif cell wall-anchored protein